MRRRLMLVPLFFFLFPLALAADEAAGVQVETSIPGVKVFVDDEYQGETAASIVGKIYLRVSLAPGRYTLRCEHPDYTPVIDTITVQPDIGFLTYSVRFTTSRIVAESLNKSAGNSTIKTGVLIVKSIPSGAYIALDERTVGETTDCRISELPIGKHAVNVRFNDRLSLSLDISIENDQELTVTADFDRMRIWSDAKYTVNIGSTPEGADCYIDDKKQGTTPLQLTLAQGEYELRLRREGYIDHNEHLVVASNDYLKFDLIEAYDLYLVSTPSRTPAWIDGVYAGQTPLILPLAKGRHVIELKADGYLDHRSPVYLSDTEYRRFVLTKPAPVLAFRPDETYHPDSPIGIGKAVFSVPSEGNSVAAGSSLLSFNGARARFDFEEGCEYRVTPVARLPLQPLKAASEVSGLKKEPSKPRLEDTEIKEYRSEQVMSFTSAMYGGLGGVLLGALMFTDNEKAATGAAIGIGLAGAILGGVLFPDTKRVATGRTVYSEAAAKRNSEKLAKWNREREEIAQYNDALLEEANRDIVAANARIEKLNRDRGYFEIRNLTTGEETRLRY